MDVLLEMSAGTGWLARENDRVLYLPNPESVDVAHDVIEPLLVARSGNEAFDTLSSWIESERPLPLMVLIGTGSAPRAIAFGLPALVAVSTDGTSRSFAVGPTPAKIDCASIRALALHDEDERASGMLTEGVVRAGGFRLHLRRGAATTPVEDSDSDSDADADADDGPHLRLDDHTVRIGEGLVLGRWPYAKAPIPDEIEPLIIADPAVSRLHAEVRIRDGSVVAIDRSSHNGTTVVAAETGRRFRLEPEVAFPVESGDQLLIGDTVITVV